ncbi:unnamed protein product [Hermetia illucens]|uniref:Peptidase S1 domain-containing protein n=1 Tax=Hermetia illucens TaxID=343691 RepID=A0A7R8UPV9_HERIL|nr:serine protease snake-like isoform X1 [Hermetia illucens]CAD7084460.1 unnamed protein product [Hermetia illucens]
MRTVIFLAIVVFSSAKSQSESLSAKKCQEFYSTADNKQFKEPSESGLELAESDEFPYMVAIGWKNKDGLIDYRCAGVLIDPKFIVAPAYCAAYQGEKPSVVQVGKTQLNEPSQAEDSLPIKNIIVHPDRKEDTFYNDIALYELEAPVAKLPACLWDEAEISNAENTLVTYDRNETESEKADKLIKIKTKLHPNDQCMEFYRIFPNADKGIMDTQLCAVEINTKDCRIQASGPLLLQKLDDKKSIPYVIGISSFTSECSGDSAPSIYSKIPAYAKWIESVVWV